MEEVLLSRQVDDAIARVVRQQLRSERELEHSQERVYEAQEAFTRQKVKAESLEHELDALRRRVVQLEGDVKQFNERARAREGETKMATIETKATGLAKVTATTKGDLKAVAPRLGARQAARLARDVVVTKGVADRLPVDPEVRKSIVRFLKTKKGEALMGGLLGMLLTYVELPGVPQGERTEKLAEALRQEALTEFGDELVEPFAAIVREVLTNVLGGMADDTATVEVAPTSKE